jgi:hypothetical protein
MTQEDPNLDLWYRAEQIASLSHPYPKIGAFLAGFIVATLTFIATYLFTILGVYDFQQHTAMKAAVAICGFCLGCLARHYLKIRHIRARADAFDALLKKEV